MDCTKFLESTEGWQNKPPQNIPLEDHVQKMKRHAKKREKYLQNNYVHYKHSYNSLSQKIQFLKTEQEI